MHSLRTGLEVFTAVELTGKTLARKQDAAKKLGLVKGRALTPEGKHGAATLPEQESSSPVNQKYSRKLREKAVSMVDRRRIRNPRDRTIFREVAEQLSVGEQSLRLWVRRHDAERLGIPSTKKPESGAVALELEALRRKIEKLRAENDVLKRAFVAFSSEWSRD